MKVNEICKRVKHSDQEAFPGEKSSKGEDKKEQTPSEEKKIEEKGTAKSAEKKAPAKKEAVKEAVTLQFAGKSYSTEELVKIAKDVWKYDLKQKVSDFKSVELFVKPEESVCYYIINGDVTGNFGI